MSERSTHRSVAAVGLCLLGCAPNPPTVPGPDVPEPAQRPEVYDTETIRGPGYTLTYETYVMDLAKGRNTTTGIDGPTPDSQRVAAEAVTDYRSAFERALRHFAQGAHPLHRHVDVLSEKSQSAEPLQFHQPLYPPLSPEALSIPAGYGPFNVALHFEPTPLLLRRIVWRQFVASQSIAGDRPALDESHGLARLEQEWTRSYDALMPRYLEIVAAGQDPAVVTEGGNILYRIGRELGQGMRLLALYRRYQADPQLFAEVAATPLPEPPTPDAEFYPQLSRGIGFLARVKIVFALFSGEPIPRDYLDMLDRPDIAQLRLGLDVLAMLPDEQWAAHHEAIFSRLERWTNDELAQNEFIDRRALAALRSAVAAGE